jgi:hypothetical protein
MDDTRSLGLLLEGRDVEREIFWLPGHGILTRTNDAKTQDQNRANGFHCFFHLH